ncbi:MAG: ATP-binding protein, partial [Mycoplasmataceae bacterium]|nr:ATP-binding protein [Mycoplasmataceae bacterium]
TKWEFVFQDDNNRELTYNIHFSDKIHFEEFKMKDPLSTNKKEIVIFRKDLNEKGDKVNYLYEELKKTNINLSILNSSKSLLYFFSTIFKNDLVESLMKEFKKIEWIDNTFPINKTLTPFNIPIFNIGDVKIIIENKSVILKIFKDLDINITDIDIKEDPLNPASVIVRLCKMDLYENNYWINYNNESNGTQKLIILLAKLIKGIHNKNIFIIDELDSGLHTRILKYLILMFTNNKKNKGAQLMFSSHDMPTLTREIFRKDEIYFAAINDSRFTSIISLWDFGSDVREANNFSKTYLDGKLGYDPYVDYSLKGFKDSE